jgi:translocator protein
MSLRNPTATFPSTVRALWALPLSMGLCVGVGWFGARFTPGLWYERLAKPAWTPPDALFAPVWMLLYAMMAVAAWLVWLQEGFARGARPLGMYGIQLAFNAAWSWIFFGLHQPGLAFGEIGVLWILIVWTVVEFWRRSRPAGLLLVPYFAWVSYAVALNFSIWRLNS